MKKLCLGEGTFQANITRSMSCKIRTFLLFLLFASLALPPCHARPALLPRNLPNDLDTPEIQKALQTWVNHSVVSPGAFKTTTDGQSINVYFFLRFVLDDMEGTDSEKAVLAFKIFAKTNVAIGTYNTTGAEIGVRFIPYIQIVNHEQVVFQSSEEPTIITKPLLIYIKDGNDTFWSRKNQIKKAGTARAYTMILMGKAYLPTDDLDAITHELNHLLLHNNDAYPKFLRVRKKMSCHLEMLNAKNCQPTSLHPIEIYTGLKRAGIIPPLWNQYVDRTNLFKWSDNNILQLISAPKDQIESQLLQIEISDRNSKGVVYSKSYNYHYKDVVSEIVGDFSNTLPPTYIDVNWLPQGSYEIKAKLRKYTQIKSTIYQSYVEYKRTAYIEKTR